MNRRVVSRLNRLVVVARAGENPSAPDRRWEHFERWLSAPTFPLILDMACADRAHRRYLFEVGLTAETEGLAWYRLDDADRGGRADAEAAALALAVGTLGAEAGWASWWAEAAAWPTAPDLIDDAEHFARRLTHERAIVDGHRGRWAAWRRRFPAWHPGMTEEEANAFDHALARVHRERAREEGDDDGDGDGERADQDGDV